MFLFELPPDNFFNPDYFLGDRTDLFPEGVGGGRRVGWDTGRKGVGSRKGGAANFFAGGTEDSN